MTDAPINFELESPESWKRVAHVTVSPERMELARAEVVEELRKKASIPGFRKGKVPAQIIRNQYAGQVEQEALERVIPLAYQDVLAAHDELVPITEPRVSNLGMEEGEPVRFDLEIEVRPELEISGIEKLDVERIELKITDERVDQAMGDLADRNAKWAPVHRAATPGDALEIDFAPLNEEGQAREEDRTHGYAMILGAEGVLPEFNAALEGMEPNEDTQVEVVYPEDYPREDLQGRTMSFEVKLTEVKEKQIPALDDDFAQSVSPHKTIHELREMVREELVRTSTAESERHFREALVDKVLSSNQIPVPPSLEARYLHAFLHDYEHRSGQELDDETKAKLAESIKPSAKRAAQRMLLVDEIRRGEKLEVSEDELAAKIATLAEERGVSAEDYRRALEANKALDRFQSELEEEKVFAFLGDKVKVTVVEKTGSEDEAQDSDDAQQGQA